MQTQDRLLISKATINHVFQKLVPLRLEAAPLTSPFIPYYPLIQEIEKIMTPYSITSTGPQWLTKNTRRSKNVAHVAMTAIASVKKEAHLFLAPAHLKFVAIDILKPLSWTTKGWRPIWKKLVVETHSFNPHSKRPLRHIVTIFVDHGMQYKRIHFVDNTIHKSAWESFLQPYIVLLN